MARAWSGHRLPVVCGQGLGLGPCALRTVRLACPTLSCSVVRTASLHSISKRTGPNTFSCLKALLASPTVAAHRRWCPCGHKQLSRFDSGQQLRVSSQLFWLAPQCAHFCARSGLPTRASSGRGRALRRGSSSARRATGRGGPWTRGTRGTHGATVEWGRFLRGKL